MPISKDDLLDFTIFAVGKLGNGGANSLVELASEWEAKRGSSGMTLDVEIDANTARWLAKYFPDMRDDARLQRALERRGGVTTAEMLRRAAAAAKEAGRG